MQESSIDIEQVIFQQPTVYWLPELDLTLDDRQALTGGRWLSSRHMSAVHTLLRKQYPGQNGLQDTLQLSRWAFGSKDFVQIVHISQNHWVCVSNLLTPEGVVEVYDSLPATCNNTLTRQVTAIVQCSGQQFTVRWINVQLQCGGDDCALFAVAFAEALCAGQDPRVLSFNQSQMRQHLLKHGEISSFPKSQKQKRQDEDVPAAIAFVDCHGISMRRWFSVFIAKSGFIRSACLFLIPSSWTLSQYGHAVIV